MTLGLENDILNLKFYVDGANKTLHWVKMLAAKPEDMSLESHDPHGRRKEQILSSCSLTFIYKCSQTYIQIKIFKCKIVNKYRGLK